MTTITAAYTEFPSVTVGVAGTLSQGVTVRFLRPVVRLDR